MSSISTHVLDTASGRPASGLRVVLEREARTGWELVGEGITDADGRIGELLGDDVTPGAYRLVFATGAYHDRQGLEAFFPEVTVTFAARPDVSHYHVPLLLSPFGYATYRGS